MSRERTVMMARIKDEARWIGRNLERTWQVCQKVVLLDDGSTDGTFNAAMGSITHAPITTIGTKSGVIIHGTTDFGPAELHFIRSPFGDEEHTVRRKERRNEMRDKNLLWNYVKQMVDFDYVLCLDGDEMLSLQALRSFPLAWDRLKGELDWILLPFIYLWDSENLRRVDGVYGDGEDFAPRLRFPRMFTIRRLDEQMLYDTRFHWTGTRGGLHCGSIPQEGFQPIRPISDLMRDMPIIHFGYLDSAMRQQKYEMYNELDPGNEFEGFYKHIIGKRNRHQPGDVRLEPWSDQ